MAGCSAISDPALDAVRQALQNEGKDPGATRVVLETSLNKVKDKQIVGVLLSYLQEKRLEQAVYFGNIGQVNFYLERISNIKSHMYLDIAGPAYLDKRDWDNDIAQWQEWWDANKDYIYWDEQAQAMKVKPH
jgi:hypothetical protein